jgi:GNAT superfamily N-acetyltransferase
MDKATESNRIFIDAWDALCHLCPVFETRRGGLVETSWSGYPVSFFNLAVTARSPVSLADFEHAARDTAEWAAERKLPWIFAVCHETLGNLLPEAGQALERMGLVPMMPLTGMEASKLAPPSRPTPDAAWLTETGASTGGDVIRLNEAAYQMALGEPGSLAMERPDWWRSPDRMASVLAPEGCPASTAAVLGVDGLRYVALVATHPESQRKGYAEAAMRDVLQRSLDAGLQPRTYLHASAAGRPVYERMGYRPTAEYTVYLGTPA